MKEHKYLELDKDLSKYYVILYLNRPDQLNALSYELAVELYDILKEISIDKEIRSLIITGRGKAFCGGGDLIEFKKADDPQDFLSKLAYKLHESLKLLKTMRAPSIAAVNGACFGAGLGLALSCDLRICSENASFGSAFTGVGLSPDSSTTFHLPKIVGLSIANEMIFLNRILTAEEAKKFNLVLKVIESDNSLLDEGKKLAIKLSSGAPIAFANAKKLINDSFHNNLETHLKLEADNIKVCAGTEDFQEGVKAFLEKRKPNFQGK